MNPPLRWVLRSRRTLWTRKHPTRLHQNTIRRRSGRPLAHRQRGRYDVPGDRAGRQTGRTPSCSRLRARKSDRRERSPRAGGRERPRLSVLLLRCQSLAPARTRAREVLVDVGVARPGERADLSAAVAGDLQRQVAARYRSSDIRIFRCAARGPASGRTGCDTSASALRRGCCVKRGVPVDDRSTARGQPAPVRSGSGLRGPMRPSTERSSSAARFAVDQSLAKMTTVVVPL